eukprot:symbB.v1.2.019236.t1/scaffold1567.1/size111240/5
MRGEAAVERSVGHSALATRSQMSLDGIPKAEVLRSYCFLGDGMILNVTYSFNALTSISDLEVWLGTSDDWIGTSDRPTKEQGSLALGQFVPEQHGQILQVKSGEESVIVFSPNSESHAIILEHYGNWPAVSASTKSDVARSTSDGAYAIYVPLGSMEPGETKSATIFYAAAGANHLEELLRVTEAVKQISTTTTTTSSTSWTLPTTTTTTLPYVLQSPYLKLGLLADGGRPTRISAMPCGCPNKCDPSAYKVMICCSWPELTEELKGMGITEQDWEATKKMWNGGRMMLLAAYLIVTLILVGICLALTLAADVSGGIWALMSAINLARFANFYILPTVTERMKNEIYAKKNIDVSWIMQCGEGLAFKANTGAQTLGA